MRWTVSLLSLMLSASLQAAVTIYLKSGETEVAEKLESAGGKFTISAAGQTKPLDPALVDRIDMPEPASLLEAQTAFLAGDNMNALLKMGKARAELEPLKALPGLEDLWLDSEFLRAQILVTQKRLKDIEASMKDIASRAASDPDAARRAEAYLAHIAGVSGDPKVAIEKLTALIAQTTDAGTLADANNFLGQHLLNSNKAQEAALAFLRVHVFYANLPIPTAQARLGAGKALMAMENFDDARGVLRDLVLKQPKTEEAQEGKKLLRQVEDQLGLDKDARTQIPTATTAPPAPAPKAEVK